MDNQVAQWDQGIYYPVNPVDGSYYEYVYTGTEPPGEWDQHQKFIGLDGQNLQFPGLQNENFPCVYYTPSYDYPQSPYNPYNPYIPGAVVGSDAQLMGTQYMQTAPQTGYFPVIHQSGSDAVITSHPDALFFDNGSVKYTAALSSMSVATTPLKGSLENLSFEPTYPANQINTAGRYLEGVGVNAASRPKFMPYGEMTSGGALLSQVTNHSSQGGALSIPNPLKVALPASNGYTNDRTRPRIQNGFSNKTPSEQNMGPRTNKTKTQLSLPICLKAYTTKAGNSNSDGNIVLNPDEYNKDDFSVDHPDAKFFVIKSYSEDDVHKSIKYNVWSSTINGNKKLDKAYEEAQILSAGKPRKCPVFLFFSVNASGHFCGVAEMIGPVDFLKSMNFWLQDKWTGCFPVKWHIIKDVPNSSFRHIILVNNECRPVTSSRDTQDVSYLPGINMLTIFKNSPLKTWILDDFTYYEERQRIMHEEKLMLYQAYEKSVNGRNTNETSFSNATTDDEVTPPPNNAIGKETSVNIIANGNETSVDVIANGKATGANSTDLSSGKITNVSSTELANGKEADYGASKRPSNSNAQKLINANNKSNQLKELKNPAQNEVRISSRKAKVSEKSKETKKLAHNDAHVDPTKANNLEASGNDIGKNDVLTVGSMQINITDTNRLISGTLTIGSIPVDIKGSKT